MDQPKNAVEAKSNTEIKIQRSWLSILVAKEYLRDHLENTRRLLLKECDTEKRLEEMDLKARKPNTDDLLFDENVESFKALQRELELGHLFLNPRPADSDSNDVSSHDLFKEAIRSYSPRNIMVLSHVDALIEDSQEVWRKVKAPKRIDYLDTIYQMICHNVAPTITVKVDDNRFYCHSMMLSTLSTYFSDCIGTMTVALPSSMVSSRSFINICGWVLEPMTVVTIRHLIELIRATDYLELTDLHQECMGLIYELLSHRINFLSIFTIARYVYPRLAFEIFPQFGQFWMPFVTSTDFLELNYHDLKHYVLAANVAVNSHIEVFYAIINWLDYQWDQRKHYVWQLMDVIQLDTLPHAFLLTFLMRQDGPDSFQWLVKDHHMQQLIIQSLENSYKTKDKFVVGNGMHKNHLIYDPCCKYHHSKKCKRPRYVTYDQFMEYLSFVKADPMSFMDRVQPHSDPSIVCCSYEALS